MKAGTSSGFKNYDVTPRDITDMASAKIYPLFLDRFKALNERSAWTKLFVCLEQIRHTKAATWSLERFESTVNVHTQTHEHARAHTHADTQLCVCVTMPTQCKPLSFVLIMLYVLHDRSVFPDAPAYPQD